jgi:hypothetical protein
MKDKDKDRDVTNADVVEAIRDLTRILIAMNGEFESKSQLIRKLDDLSMPSARIAALLNMQSKDVASVKYKKNKNDSKNEKSTFMPPQGV